MLENVLIEGQGGGLLLYSSVTQPSDADATFFMYLNSVPFVAGRGGGVQSAFRASSSAWRGRKEEGELHKEEGRGGQGGKGHREGGRGEGEAGGEVGGRGGVDACCREGSIL